MSPEQEDEGDGSMSATGWLTLVLLLLAAVAMIFVVIRRRRRGGGVFATKAKP